MPLAAFTVGWCAGILIGAAALVIVRFILRGGRLPYPRLPVAAIRSRRLRLQPGTSLQPTPRPDHVASDEWCRPTPDCTCRACNCTCHGCTKGHPDGLQH